MIKKLVFVVFLFLFLTACSTNTTPNIEQVKVEEEPVLISFSESDIYSLEEINEMVAEIESPLNKAEGELQTQGPVAICHGRTDYPHRSTTSNGTDVYAKGWTECIGGLPWQKMFVTTYLFREVYPGNWMYISSRSAQASMNFYSWSRARAVAPAGACFNGHYYAYSVHSTNAGIPIGTGPITSASNYVSNCSVPF